MYHEWDMDGGQLVREGRLRANLSQRDLAAATGLTQPTIARIEGGRSALTTAQLTRLLRACGLEPRVALVRVDDSDWSIALANLQLDTDGRVRQHAAAVRFAEAGRTALARAKR
jgi:transcriptional regulator with XRE-family HTH domain